MWTYFSSSTVPDVSVSGAVRMRSMSFRGLSSGSILLSHSMVGMLGSPAFATTHKNSFQYKSCREISTQGRVQGNYSACSNGSYLAKVYLV